MSGAVSVVVTTYRRTDRLAACLHGLREQTRSPDEVVVVVHASDDASADRVEQLAGAWRELRCARVERHGLVAALNCGLAAAQGAIVAFVDDDAVPAADWLERIATAFDADERIAAVGGRDVVVVDGRVLDGGRRGRLGRRAKPLGVGRIQWFGRMLGNHHLGAGAARDVDVLKGANMSFRRSAVVRHGFDERLRGRGAQEHSELAICLPLRRQGLRVVYDPGIVVLHYPAPRPHGDQRGNPGREAVRCSAHNEALQILDHFGPGRRLVFAAWGLAVGTTGAPGLAVLARDLLNGRPAAWARFGAAQRGRAAAWRTRRTPRAIPAALRPPDASPGRRERDVVRVERAAGDHAVIAQPLDDRAT
ncbi:MAG TPA: glycosyltransferase [Conexibacter sp.]|jgi:GT2 family glycosyltransferase|nr:glycosyltransferase [Conexibacter sp.]